MGLIKPSDILSIIKDDDGNPEVEVIESPEELDQLWKGIVQNLIK